MIDFRPWDVGHPGLAERLRPTVPGIAREAAQEIVRQIPEYARPHDVRYADVLETAVQHAIGHFVSLVGDPDASWTEVVDFFEAIGVGEALEGRTLDVWTGALRLGARVAVRRLTEATADDTEVPTSVYGRITGAIFPYLDVLAAIAARGHAEAMAQSSAEYEGFRRKLLDLLIQQPAGDESVVRDLARRAGWPLPRTVALVALHERPHTAPHRPAVPPEILVGFHLSEPCLLVPDPDGPGRRAMLAAALRDWAAAVGPTVALREAAMSLRWAREALSFAQRGIVPEDGLVVATEHMPALVILQHRDLVDRVAARRLAPLMEVRPRQRHPLAETLLACLESGFTATEVAGRMRVHAQTIRYRLRKLEELFGEEMYDPALRLEFQMVLYAWLATTPAPESEDA